MIDRSNSISTSLWTKSSSSTTLSTIDTYYRRNTTCRYQTGKERPIISTQQAGRAPTHGYTTPRNLEATTESMARPQHQEQKPVGRRPCFTIQYSGQRKT